MFSDEKHDWARVTASGLIYTIRCKKNCEQWPLIGHNYDEIDGNLMWITFEISAIASFIVQAPDAS